jgi:hypothetical protein
VTFFKAGKEAAKYGDSETAAGAYLIGFILLVVLAMILCGKCNLPTPSSP